MAPLSRSGHLMEEKFPIPTEPEMLKLFMHMGPPRFAADMLEDTLELI